MLLLDLVRILYSSNVFSRIDPPKIPFKNLSFPIPNVTDCWTYSQTLASMHKGDKLVCPSNDIVFYTDSSKIVTPVVDGLVAGVHQIYDSWVVVVKHKAFYFSYFGLSEVFVNKGDSVCQDIMLGRTKFNEDCGKYSVGLQLDTEKGTLNPEAIFNYMKADSVAVSLDSKHSF